MANIAVLIGVSRYNAAAQLPACAHDVENLSLLLNATRKFEDVHCLCERTEARQLKDDLRAFFVRHRANGPVSEVFVYFSGHGVYQNDALFCCSDFDNQKPASTSISNSELDELLRSVAPEVAVKVIDACQSGSPYIKDAGDNFEKALHKSSLKSFVCMASSKQEQSSYATQAESRFTSRWIEAALSKPEGTVYYRDIEAYLADSFASDPDQTPYFVNQGTGLESFSSVTSEMRALSAQRSKTTIPSKPYLELISSIDQAVSREDKRYVSLNVATNAVEKSKELLGSYTIADDIVRNFYDHNVTTDSKFSSLPGVTHIAQFAHRMNWGSHFFVRIIYIPELVKVPKNPFAKLRLSLIPGLMLNEPADEAEDYVTREIPRPDSIETTEQLPFEVLELSYFSQHPSLSAFRVYSAIAHSQTDVTVVSATVRLVRRWGERTPNLKENPWRYDTYPWSDIVKDASLLWRGAVTRSEAEIRQYLEGFTPGKELGETSSVLGVIGDSPQNLSQD